MNAKALKTLEFYKITEMLTSHADSSLGQEKCRELRPSCDINEIRRRQRETRDGVSRLLRLSAPSFAGARDIRSSLVRLQAQGVLSQSELLQIAGLLETAAKVKSYGRHERDDAGKDSLDPLFDALEPLTPLSSEIRHCILSEDEISDDASPELRQIRRTMKLTGERIHTQLNSFLNGSGRMYLQEAVITMRNGRYCVPVKAEYKNQVQGMIHDQSSTGATIFVEPIAIVRLNNEIRELETKEAREIERILASLSGAAAEEAENLRYNLQYLTDLDFIFARASLALEMNATEPEFNEDGIVALRKARHPLIDKKKVVPIDLRLGEEFDLLVITGPNTGGKTVSLKTLGLLALMGQSGLHIPTMDRSRLSVFKEIYADIGDEQSIEQSLSTFSSHMTNIVSFLEQAVPGVLVLFDELGAGTDPTEGAALAIAILDHLHQQGIRTMATTHYSELKMYALSTPGVENASCEFNVETLRPTYRLLIGIPGKSNAFAISGKLGLPGYIIDRAKKEIDEQSESFEDVLTRLEGSRVALEQDKEQIEAEKRELLSRKEQLDRRQEKLDRQQDQSVSKAKEEARRILQEAKDYADQTMRDFQKFGKANVSVKEMEKHRAELRERIRKTQTPEREKETIRPHKQLKPEDIRIGDMVKVLSMNVNGTISTRPDSKGNLFVQMGIIRSKVNLSDLELVDEPVITGQGMSCTGSGKVKLSKSLSVKTEINLLGYTVDEAVAALDKYLDDAIIAHLPSVRVVHGKGTGALRKGIHTYLQRQKHVKEFHLAEFGEGDAGVTIVTFK